MTVIDMSGSASGIYTVQLADNGGIYSHKFAAIRFTPTNLVHNLFSLLFHLYNSVIHFILSNKYIYKIYSGIIA
jgi:hypothetical protein